MILTCAMQQEKRLELSTVRECLQEASEEHQQNDRASVRLWTAVATDRHSYIPVELRLATALQKLG